MIKTLSLWLLFWADTHAFDQGGGALFICLHSTARNHTRQTCVWSFLNHTSFFLNLCLNSLALISLNMLFFFNKLGEFYITLNLRLIYIGQQCSKLEIKYAFYY